jgi:hypothetical protein
LNFRKCTFGAQRNLGDDEWKLHNASAGRELTVILNGACLKHDPQPVYLGVTLDRTLSYKEHLQKTANKLKTRNNLLTKLVGTKWGATQMPAFSDPQPWLFVAQSANTVPRSGRGLHTQISLMYS